MKDLFLIFIIIFYGIIMIYGLYYIYKCAKKSEELRKYYPVHLRVTDKYILQYSIDNKKWEDIIAFNSNMKYINKDGKIYEGPGFVPLRIRKDQTISDWKDILGSLQQVHAWNKKAFEDYKESIYKYLEEN